MRYKVDRIFMFIISILLITNILMYFYHSAPEWRRVSNYLIFIAVLILFIHDLLSWLLRKRG